VSRRWARDRVPAARTVRRESEFLKHPGGQPDRAADLLAHRRRVEPLPHTDAHAFDDRRAQRHGSGERVLRIVACQRRKQQPQVFRGARHRSGDRHQSRGMAERWEVARCRNAAGRRFQPRDSAEVRGQPDRSAAIGPDTARRAARGNGRGLAAARSAGSAFQIPRIIGTPGDEAVRLVARQQAGRIRFAEQNSALVARARHRRGVSPRNMPDAQAAARLCRQPGNVKAVFHRNGYAVQRAEWFAARDGLLARSGLREGLAGSTVTNAFSAGLRASISCRCAWTRSTGERAPSRTIVTMRQSDER
jgi:hypothetical protein